MNGHGEQDEPGVHGDQDEQGARNERGKSAAEITEIYETLALNSYHRGSIARKGGRYDIDRSTEVALQLSTMSKQMEALTKNVSQLQAGANHVCDGGHHCRDGKQVESEEAQALNYQRGRNDP
ncbi:hypothetical protein LWI28_025519 [Acer negundo]|uniref:Uncharacterized protein n=1 Tax=Acer negundo TaxID=4023 RepID=A0AAD5JG47_ACENE|nr:hypothetical protein LWI28_025519 [Acer negundo]